MKFLVGEKVQIKNTKEEGKVVRLIPPDMVELEVINTRFSIFVNELQVPNQERFSSKKLNEKKRALSLDDFESEIPDSNLNSKEVNSGLEEGFYLSLIPVYFFDEKGEEQLARIKLYFINQTSYLLKMQYDCVSNQGNLNTLGTTVYPFQHVNLHSIKLDQINDKLSFHFKLENDGKTVDAKQLEHSLSIKPKMVFQRLQQLEASGETLFSIKIATDFPIIDFSKLSSQTLFNSAAKPSNSYNFKKRNSKSTLIDLHLEHLMDASEDLGSHQKLEAQLIACEQAVMEAYYNQSPSMIIIHGVGGGKLRDEVHRLLKTMKPQVRLFENKYSQKYGFGATEVFLKY